MTIRNDATRLRVPQRDKRLRRGVLARQGQVLLDADLNQQGEALLGRVEAEARAVMGSPGRLVYPAGTTGFAITPDGAPANFNIGAGDGYLDGWLLQNPATTKLTTQFHPCAPAALPATALIVVKALVRHIDPVEELRLPDVALGDAQAAGRGLIDWQVLPVAVTQPDPLTDTAYTGMIAASTGKLAFKAKAAVGSTDPCSLTPQGGYSRHENLLYRVEVHGGTAADQRADGPRFGLHGLKLKFSRRNASTMARITRVDQNRITVAPPPLDPGNWFAPGTWAEIVSIHDDLDPTTPLAAERLFQVAQAVGDIVTLTEVGAATVATTGAVTPAQPGDEPTWFLRLWDAFPATSGATPSGIATVSAPSNDSTEIDLGDGLAIQLTGGAAARFRRGDYWTCAVRADGTIAWLDGTLANAAEPPQGPETHYGPLALITPSGITDLRIPLATLTDRALLYRGGDGQMAPMGSAGSLAKLPAKLRVAVMRGETPVPGARVRWTILDPGTTGGQLAVGGSTGTDLHLMTGPDGLSEIDWSIDPAHADRLLQVSADLEDGVQPGTPPIIFSASFDHEGSHGGCSTYVIPEGSDWVALLEAMDLSQDVAVCFQRGFFKTHRTVTLTGLRNIKISGAGDGTVLLGRSLETVLKLEGFASATVERLRIETGDIKRTHGKGKDRFQGRNGSLRLFGCAISEVRECTLRCGGQAVTGRTALNVGGTSETPIKLARVIDNRVITGFLQDGILVTDCIDTTITGNELVAARRSEMLGDKLIADARHWKASVARAMLFQLSPFTKPGGFPNVRTVRFRGVQAEFLSPVPQEEWDKLAAAMPLDLGRQPTKEEVAAHLDKMIDTVIADSAGAPDTVRSLLDGARTRGSRFDAAGRKTLASSILLPGGVDVVKARPRRPLRDERPRVVSDGGGVRFGTFGVHFTSPIDPVTWAQIYNDDDVHTLPPPRNAAMLSEQLLGMAMLLAGDARLRAKFAPVKDWYDRMATVAPAAARQAITCGGATLRNVAITGNRAKGYACGAHVGVSYGSDQGTRTIENARITDNDFALRLASPHLYGPAAVFLGNVETGRIDRNLIVGELPDNQDAAGWLHGVRVWGRIGHYLMISENRIDGPRIGIKVKQTDTNPDRDFHFYLWVAKDNLVMRVPTPDVLHAPKLMQDRDNRPI